MDQHVFAKDPKKTSAAYKNAVSVLHALARTEGVDAASDAAAEALAPQYLHGWVKRHSVKRAGGRRHWKRLLGRQPTDRDIAGLPGDDHTSLWLKDGKAVRYVSQPYGLQFDNLQKMVQIADREGLEFSIGAWPAWHYPGRVLFIEWTEQGHR